MLAVSVFTAFEPFPFLATSATIPTTPQMMQRSAPVQRSAEYWAAEGAKAYRPVAGATASEAAV